ncbi:MAG: arsenate reductase ArsC [Euryarchaeota archaeon]|nr:arsenate reductase ArsC [Euryarchaeota archaeon]
MDKMRRVVFVCIGNSGRSIMAEAIFNSMAPRGWKAESGGTRPARSISREAVEVLEEIGVKVEKRHPTFIDPITTRQIDVGITMGCGVESEGCPVVLTGYREDWSLPDPKGFSKEQFRLVRDQIREKVEDLVRRIEAGEFDKSKYGI